MSNDLGHIQVIRDGAVIKVEPFKDGHELVFFSLGSEDSRL